MTSNFQTSYFLYQEWSDILGPNIIPIMGPLSPVDFTILRFYDFKKCQYPISLSLVNAHVACRILKKGRVALSILRVNAHNNTML